MRASGSQPLTLKRPPDKYRELLGRRRQRVASMENHGETVAKHPACVKPGSGASHTAPVLTSTKGKMMTKTINYSGPKTVKEAEAIINRELSAHNARQDESVVAEVVEMLESNGYAGVAKRIRKEWAAYLG